MPAAPAHLARGWPVWALALGQTLAYACLYYIFAALILAWRVDPGWSQPLLAAGPTLAIVLAAGSAPLMGRLVDRGYGPELLTGGAVAGAAALAFLATVQSPGAYLAAWAAIGLAQGASLYEVCFAFLIRRLGPEARSAIIRVTLVAGFASTLAFPAGAALSAALGWRGAVWVAAGVALLVLAPLNWAAGQGIRRGGAQPTAAGRSADAAQSRRALRLPAFWGLAALFSLVALNHWMLVNFMVPVFVAQGQPQALAVAAASTVGPAQVAGRLILMRYEARIGNALAARITILGMILAALALWAAGLSAPLIFAFTVLQGAAVGVMTILRPVLIAEVMGQRGYGAIAGMIQIPALLAGAAAPMLGAVLLEGPGVGGLIAVSLALSGCALAAVAWLIRSG